MVGQVDDGGLIGGGGVIHHQRIVIRQLIGHGDVHVAGEPVIPVRAVACEHQTVVHDAALISQPAEGAVQMVGPVVGLQIVGFAVQGEFRLFNAVGVAAHKRAQRRGARLVVGQLPIAQHYVPQNAAAVRDPDVGDYTSVLNDANFHTAGVFRVY